MEGSVDSGGRGRLAAAYSALMEGILYPGSEGNSPYQPLCANLAENAALTPETFGSAAGIDSAWLVELANGDGWFEDMIANARDPDAGNDPAAAQAYELLRRMMLATLTGPILGVRSDCARGRRLSRDSEVRLRPVGRRRPRRTRGVLHRDLATST